MKLICKPEQQKGNHLFMISFLKKILNFDIY